MRHVIAWFEVLALSIGGPGLFLVALADASFLSLPEANDALVLAVAPKGPWYLFYYAAMATAGSVVGSLILYHLGKKGGEALFRKRFTRDQVERVQTAIRRYGVIGIIVPSMLPPPVPLKPFAVGAGVIGMPATTFVWSILLGRGLRYGIEAVLAYCYGRAVVRFLGEHGTAAAIGAGILVVAGLVVYGWWSRPRPAAEV